MTIEPEGDNFIVVEHGEYEEWSVLAGQYRRSIVGYYETLQEALDEYPDAEVLDHQTQACARVPDVPFDTFDPADAGEEW